VLSVVTPVLDEADNLDALHTRLVATLDGLGLDWEWVVVDDHSAAPTVRALADLAAAEPRLRVVRLTRTVGSHAAIVCGLDHARGDGVVVMSADLQDRPEDVAALVAPWRAGTPVVWATRAADGTDARAASSHRYERFLRRTLDVDALPPTNADFVLLDRRVVDAVRAADERRVPLFMLVAWLGFPSTTVECAKQPRAAGTSGWTRTKRLELAIDSVVAFTERPLRWIGGLGIVTAVLGLVYAAVVVVLALFGDRPVTGWASLMVVVLVVAGVQMLMLAVIGAYVYRSLDETRRRPRYVVEADSGAPGGNG
jgi:dolichol-phosphate mannosyltransferase